MPERTEIRIGVILHATEDPERFFAAFAAYGLSRDDFETSRQTGHFENPITVLSASIRGRAAWGFLTRLAQGMDGPVFEEALEEAGAAGPDGALYLRLDRQEFVQGRPGLSQASPVRIRVMLHGRRGAGAYARLLEEARGGQASEAAP